jgi:hypothetical protein
MRRSATRDGSLSSATGSSPSRDAEDHKQVRELFQENRDWGTAGLLGSLRLWRNACDYNDEAGNLQVMTSEAIKRAREIIGSLEVRY